MNCWRDGDEGEDVGRPAQIAGYVQFVQRTPPSPLREQQPVREMVSNSGAQRGGRESISSSCWAVSPSELRRDFRINGNIGRFNISAKDTVRGKKTAIQKILSVDNRFILQKVYEKGLITERDYNNLKNLNKEDPEGHVIELVDKIMNKGEDICKHFLKLLQYDNDITTTFPQLKNLQLNYTHFLPKPGRVSPPQRGVLRQNVFRQRDPKPYSRKAAPHNSPGESRSVINNQTLSVIKKLDSSEVAEVCFLCRDVIKWKHLKNIRAVAGLFLGLAENGLLKNIMFLKQLLIAIQRKDLAALLGTDGGQLEETDGRPHLSKYRLMLYRIHLAMKMKHFKRMKILLRSKLTRRELDRCKTALDVFAKMEKRGLISATDVDELYNVLKRLDAELAEIVNNYMNSHKMDCTQHYECANNIHTVVASPIDILKRLRFIQ